jgi:hypothetical protein
MTGSRCLTSSSGVSFRLTVEMCPNTICSFYTESCKSFAFHCPSSKSCVSSSARCNVDIDCPNGEDEQNCGQWQKPKHE